MQADMRNRKISSKKHPMNSAQNMDFNRFCSCHQGIFYWGKVKKSIKWQWPYWKPVVLSPTLYFYGDWAAAGGFSTLLECILKICPRDHQIFPLILFTADFFPFLLRPVSDEHKGKMQAKWQTLNSEETTSTSAWVLSPIIQSTGTLTRGMALQPSPQQSTLAELCLKSPKL